MASSTRPLKGPMRKPELVSDCKACNGLCCIAHPFDKSEDLAFDKAAGKRGI